MGRVVLHDFWADYAPDEGEIRLRRLQTAGSELMKQGGLLAEQITARSARRGAIASTWTTFPI